METKKVIREFFIQELSDNGFHEGVRDDQSLLDAGIIDSLGVLKLLAFLDETFGIIPLEEELNPETFSSVNSICDFVERKKG
ncbi:MAG: acyl carrier protein [Deltaproteobacteria bacterium]|nr:acyl carrier protein [Deltaproteobacteria bacterium]